MADTIQVTVRTGANADGTGGTVTLQPVVVVPDGMSNELIQAFEETYGPTMVDNPNSIHRNQKATLTPSR